MKNRFFICICAILSCCNFAAAQNSANLRPKWVGNAPKSTNADFYFVEVHSDASLSLDAARTSVKQEIASNVERTDKVSVSEIYEDKSTQKYDGSNVSMQSQDKYQLKLNVEGTARPITSRRIDEYWMPVQRGGVSVLDYHALYAIERKGAAADFSNISVVKSYASDPATWGLALIPGAAQFHKGSYRKGGAILGGTVVLVSGIIFTENQRADYAKKIDKTHDANIKRAYATRRDHFATGRNVCVGAAAALYAYNLIDAIVAPGARRVVVHKRPNGNTYAFTPAILDGNAPGMAVAMTF